MYILLKYQYLHVDIFYKNNFSLYTYIGLCVIKEFNFNTCFSGVTGSGVCILSRYQIQEVFFHQWPVNGYIHKIQHGDWFGGKGVGLCRLRIKKYNINIYSAHVSTMVYASYAEDCLLLLVTVTCRI